MYSQRVKLNIYIIINRVLGFLLPPRCFVTGAPVEAPGLLAPEAWQRLRFLAQPHCACCGIPFDMPMSPQARCVDCLDEPPAYIQARAALVYDDASKPLVLAFKYADKLEAVRTFTPLLMNALQALPMLPDVFVPVPLHRTRLLQRRYNQSAILAQAIARQAGIKVCVDALERTRPTPTQGGKKRADRFSNVKGAFTVHPARTKDIAGCHVALVDDVMTTGATADACAQALLEGGARAVSVITIARVLKDRVQVPDLAA